MVEISGSASLTIVVPHTVVAFLTLWLDIVSTISGKSFASGPRLFSAPVQPLRDFISTTPLIPLRSMSPPSRHTAPRLYRAPTIFWTLICSLIHHCCVSITLRRLKHRRFFTDSVLRSFYPSPRRRNYFVRMWSRQVFSLLRHRFVSITIRHLKHRRFFTESAPQYPISFLIVRTTVQEYGFARFSRYYVTDASPLHYDVSSIDGSSQSWYRNPLSGADIFYGGSQTSCSQNPLVRLFNVDFDFFAFFRMRALGLQVKLLYGSLLSLAMSIFRYVLAIFVYQFTVEDLSGYNRLSLLGL
ncbi:unnamed protein product [Eruca vesicaria subsp. sativa]|uniref:Uncharacterized protein n=1 Tax=Eruca vesicaria subsp. sativa TaxID=29727 RepID=A0ABC8J953_ERUVS|nr:unnamed protein product [Eruca vesicaria subsp. sativa]